MKGTSDNFNLILASGTIKTKCLIILMVLFFQIERHQIPKVLAALLGKEVVLVLDPLFS